MRQLIGWFAVLLGVLVNPISLGLLAADGSIESLSYRAVIVSGQLGLLLTGVGVLRSWDRALVRRSTAARILAIALVSAAAVVVSETVVRMVMGPLDDWAEPPVYVGELANRPSENFAVDSLLGWRMRDEVEFSWRIDGREHIYRATDEGFRSAYTATDLSNAGTLVSVIGDSFAFGTGVESDSTFAALLDRKLDGILVHNLGLPGIGIDQMWMVLRHHALPLRPRLVVVAFIDQDWDRSLTAFRTVEGMGKPTFVFEGGGLRPATEEDAPGQLIRWLERRSYLLGLGRTVERAIGYRLPVGSWWATNTAMLDAMAEEARQANAEIIFVRLPLRQAPPFPNLARHMKERGLRYFDLNIDSSEDIHFATDDHINEAGHAYVADALASEVLRLTR